MLPRIHELHATLTQPGSHPPLVTRVLAEATAPGTLPVGLMLGPGDARRRAGGAGAGAGGGSTVAVMSRP